MLYGLPARVPWNCQSPLVSHATLYSDLTRPHQVTRLIDPQTSGFLNRVVTRAGTSSAMSSSDTDQAAPSKTKILFLHGFLQNADVMRMRVGSMRKALKSRCVFEFANAPFEAADSLPAEQLVALGGRPDGGGRTWFQWTDAGPPGRPSLALEYHNWETTYESLCSDVQQHQPDGLFGFSQGATAVALFLAQLAQRQQQGQDLHIHRPSFAVMCAAFMPRDPKLAQLLQDVRLDSPSLFIIGESDTLVSPERSKQLMATFNPGAVTLYEHPGAHMVPTCSGAFKSQLMGFLSRASPAAAGAGANGDVLPGSDSVASGLQSLDGDGASGTDLQEQQLQEAAATVVAAGSAKGAAAGASSANQSIVEG